MYQRNCDVVVDDADDDVFVVVDDDDDVQKSGRVSWGPENLQKRISPHAAVAVADFENNKGLLL